MIATRSLFVLLTLALASVAHGSVLGQFFTPYTTAQTGTTMTGWSQTELAFWKGGESLSSLHISFNESQMRPGAG